MMKLQCSILIVLICLFRCPNALCLQHAPITFELTRTLNLSVAPPPKTGTLIEDVCHFLTYAESCVTDQRLKQRIQIQRRTLKELLELSPGETPSRLTLLRSLTSDEIEKSGLTVGEYLDQKLARINARKGNQIGFSTINQQRKIVSAAFQILDSPRISQEYALYCFLRTGPLHSLNDPIFGGSFQELNELKERIKSVVGTSEQQLLTLKRKHIRKYFDVFTELQLAVLSRRLAIGKEHICLLYDHTSPKDLSNILRGEPRRTQPPLGSRIEGLLDRTVSELESTNFLSADRIAITKLEKKLHALLGSLANSDPGAVVASDAYLNRFESLLAKKGITHPTVLAIKKVLLQLERPTKVEFVASNLVDVVFHAVEVDDSNAKPNEVLKRHFAARAKNLSCPQKTLFH